MHFGARRPTSAASRERGRSTARHRLAGWCGRLERCGSTQLRQVRARARAHRTPCVSARRKSPRTEFAAASERRFPRAGHRDVLSPASGTRRTAIAHGRKRQRPTGSTRTLHGCRASVVGPRARRGVVHAPRQVSNLPAGPRSSLRIDCRSANGSPAQDNDVAGREGVGVRTVVQRWPAKPCPDPAHSDRSVRVWTATAGGDRFIAPWRPVLTCTGRPAR